MSQSYLEKLHGSKVSIKKKTYAAVALLLISALLLTASSFAWLTLSLRPQLAGVSTTVGANGNLEIALASKEHLLQLSNKNMYEEDGEFVFSTGEAFHDNLLWGNILDLSDSRYGLDQLILRPSLLNILNRAIQTNNPLLVADYGEDGRMAYVDNYTALSGYDPTSQNYLLSRATEYGVRIAGTPFNAKLMDRIKAQGENLQQHTVSLLSGSKLLLEVFYDKAQSSENYNTASLRNFLNNFSLVNALYSKTVQSIEDAFSGENTTPEEASLLQAIRDSYALAQEKLDSSIAALEVLEPKPVEGISAPSPVQLTYEQVVGILSPLTGPLSFRIWDTSTKQWGEVDDPTSVSGDLSIHFVERSYFYPIALLSGSFGAGCQFNPSIRWETSTQDFSQIFYLSGQTMASKYLEYLTEFETLSTQVYNHQKSLSTLLQEEYNAEVNFFYERTLAPAEEEHGPAQPFTTAELEACLIGIDSRVEALDDIVNFLEEYTKSAVLVYASSGLLARAVYLDVLSVAADPNASLRRYIDAATLDNNPDFIGIRDACEIATVGIEGWRTNLANLMDELQPKDDAGNILEDQIRDITVEDLLAVWDSIEDMSSMAIGQFNYLTNEYDYYSAEDFENRANDIFINTISRIAPSFEEGLYGLLSREQGLVRYYSTILNPDPSFITISQETFRENNNAQYLPGDTVAFFSSRLNRYDIRSRTSASLAKSRDQFSNVLITDIWKTAYQYAQDGLTAFDDASIFDAAAQLIADLVMERVVSGADGGYSSAYYSRLGAMLEDTTDILALQEDALARQILLYAAGLTAEAEKAEQDAIETGAEETEIATKTAKKEAAAALYTETLEGWENGNLTFDALLSKVSVSDNYYFTSALGIYKTCQTSLAAAQSAYATLSEGELTWAQIESVLSHYIAKSATDLIFRDHLWPNVNGGIFADMEGVLNWYYSADYMTSPDAEHGDTSVYVSGLPADVDEAYSEIGLLEISTNLTTSSIIEHTNALAQIEYLIDRTEEGQEYTKSDREFVYDNSLLQMNSAATLANRYYTEYAKDEDALLKLLYRSALSDADIVPHFDEPEDAPKLTYTIEEINNAHEALGSLMNAVTSAENSLKYALRARIASGMTTEALYEQAILTETVPDMLQALGLAEGTPLYDLHTVLSDIRTEITEATSALKELSETGRYWGGNAMLTDAEMAEYLTQNVFSHIIPISSMTINDLSFADFSASIDDLDAPSGKTDEKGNPLTVTQVLHRDGITFNVPSGTIVSTHDLFETSKAPCSPYQGNLLVVGDSEKYLSDISSQLTISCHHTAEFVNTVSWIRSSGAPNPPSASALNNSSNYLIADTYAVAIDFLLRTNASVANLLLQTDAVQRVYQDEEALRNDDRFSNDAIEEMMGHGSYIEFVNIDPADNAAWAVLENYSATTEAQQMAERQLGRDILEALRVVFADTLTGEVYAIAAPSSPFFSCEDRTITGHLRLLDENGNADGRTIIKSLKQNQVTALTAWIYLDGEKIDNSSVDTELLSTINVNLQFCTDIQLQAAKHTVTVTPSE